MRTVLYIFGPGFYHTNFDTPSMPLKPLAEINNLFGTYGREKKERENNKERKWREKVEEKIGEKQFCCLST